MTFKTLKECIEANKGIEKNPKKYCEMTFPELAQYTSKHKQKKYTQSLDRNKIFEKLDQLVESFGQKEVLEDVFRFFSVDELNDFLEDFARLRDFDFEQIDTVTGALRTLNISPAAIQGEFATKNFTCETKMKKEVCDPKTFRTVKPNKDTFITVCKPKDKNQPSDPTETQRICRRK